MKYDVIIIGSGAGGSAAAYHLTQTGKKVLLLEKGLPLPRDGSTLDVDTVMRRGAYLSKEPWVDRDGKQVVPEEHFNLGGKTKWYGAALLRFARARVRGRSRSSVPGLADRLRRARAVLRGGRGAARRTPFRRRAESAKAGHPACAESMPAGEKHMLNVGLSPEILSYPEEASRFDGFASVRGLKSDAEKCLLDRVRGKPNLTIATGKAVRALIAVAGSPTRLAGVECEDGSRYEADAVMLAAGALHSPRLLQSYLEQSGLADTLPAYRNVGRNYKFHVLTAMLAFSHRKITDVLSKTLLLTHEAFPHSTVQTLGGNLTRQIVLTQAPAFVPSALIEPFAQRAVGLFLQTEDGSHPDQRVVAAAGSPPRIDHDPARLPHATQNIGSSLRALRGQLVRLGYLPVTQSHPAVRDGACLRHADRGQRSRAARSSMPKGACTGWRTCT